VVPVKRTVVVAGGLLAALALVGCAPRGVETAGTTGQPVAVAAAAPTETAAAAPAAGDTVAVAAAGIATDSLTAKSLPRMGKVVVDKGDWTLYRFDKDQPAKDGQPAVSKCEDKCAQVWPPVLVENGVAPKLEGIEEAKVSTIARPDGGTQLVVGNWPVYRYIGDTKAGQWTGQAVGGTWFVISPDGKPNKTCLPSDTPVAATPPGDDAAAEGAAAEQAPAVDTAPAAGGGY